MAGEDGVEVADTTNRLIRVDPPDDRAMRLWAKAIDVAVALGEDSAWTLVGGLMVQLHALEHGLDTRLTADIDVLGDARQRPSMTQRIAMTLKDLGANLTDPPSSSPDLGYKFEVDGEVVEILGPDGLKTDPKTVGKFKTFQVPGGTQALRRTEVVNISLNGGSPVAMRRPDLLGAILIKARVVAKRRKPKFQSDRQDLIVLLGLVDDPRGTAEAGQLRKSEIRWLRDVGPKLDFADSDLRQRIDSERLARAEQAFRLLTI